jgi:hypothetical protein
LVHGQKKFSNKREIGLEAIADTTAKEEIVLQHHYCFDYVDKVYKLMGG